MPGLYYSYYYFYMAPSTPTFTAPLSSSLGLKVRYSTSVLWYTVGHYWPSLQDLVDSPPETVEYRAAAFNYLGMRQLSGPHIGYML